MTASVPRTILLTGVTGFIGGALALELARGGHELAAVVRASGGVGLYEQMIDEA